MNNVLNDRLAKVEMENANLTSSLTAAEEEKAEQETVLCEVRAELEEKRIVSKKVKSLSCYKLGLTMRPSRRD